MTGTVPGTEALVAVNNALIESSTALQTAIQARKAAQTEHDQKVDAARTVYFAVLAEEGAKLQGFVDTEARARDTQHARLGAFTALLQDLDDENGLEVVVIQGNEAPVPGVVEDDSLIADEGADVFAPPPAVEEEAPVAPAPQGEAVVDEGAGVGTGDTTVTDATIDVTANDSGTTSAPADTAVTQ